MNWIFSSKVSIKETNTGYTIYLLSGTWSEPMDIKLLTPRGMTTLNQARHVRLGLAFAKELVDDESSQVGGRSKTLEKAL